jgi:CRISPR-associated protein Cas1
VPQTFRFKGRSRQPAKDEFNATLNYAYGILYSLVEKACVYAGLDPYVGFLHADNYNKKSLVFDLIEPFRILGDRAVVLLFTGRRVQKNSFESIPGGMALNREGRAFFIAHFNERLDKAVRYPIQGKPGKTRNLKQRDIIPCEAHALANSLLGKRDMPLVIETKKIWADESAPATAELPDEPDGDTPPNDAPPDDELTSRCDDQGHEA